MSERIELLNESQTSVLDFCISVYDEEAKLY